MVKFPQQPLISIVIPTYNRADVLNRAIASVLAQSYSYWELIIVDDASEDNTAEIIQQISDHRIHYLRHQTNLGGSQARNTGIERATGKYITFLDSDDVWLVNKLETQLQLIQKVAQTEKIVSYTQFEKSFQVAYRPIIQPQRGKKNSETIADYLWLNRGEILTSTLMVSRELAAKTCFNSQLKKHQDIDFLLRLEQEDHVQFIFVPQPLTIWHNEQRRDRISRIVNYQISLDWIETYRQKISPQAFQGFMVKEIIPKLLLSDNNKKYTASLIIQAFCQRVISLTYFLLLMSRVIVARKYQDKLKTLVQKIS
jgi:glycosyltransferase involved in cell wall biosynthesis